MSGCWRLASTAWLVTGLALGCGDGGSAGGGGSGAGPQGGEAEGGAPAGGAAQGGEAEGGAAAGGAGEGGALAGGAGEGGGQPAQHCADAVHCDSVDGYFCDEVSGPSAELEAACAAESGTFGEGPCSDNFGTGCVFDCETPSEYSLIGVDQAACERAGGTYVTL